VDPYRKRWNLQFKDLRNALIKSADKKKAIKLFLCLHAMVHSVKISRLRLHSFEDEILGDLSEKAMRLIPKNSNHSLVWIIWHLARVEDVTMNLLVANGQQVLNGDDWLKRMKIKNRNTGNGMNDRDVAGLSAKIDLNGLRAYRLAVGRATRKTVMKLKPEDFKRKVEPARIQLIWDEKAMVEGGRGIVNYWSKRDIAGLLLMPPTRHCFLHLNEARRIREKIGYRP
jgi:hypothetical protein